MDTDNKSPNKLLEAGYILALQYIKGKNWPDACQLLSQILEADPQYKDANAYLRYAEGRQAFEQGDWNATIEKLGGIHSFEDVQRFLNQAKQKKEAQSLYEQALALLGNSEWQQAQEKLRRTTMLDPAHREAASRLDEAMRHAASKELFDQGIEHIRRERWQEATNVFQEIINTNPTYPQKAEVKDKLEEARKQQYFKQLKDDGLNYLHRKNFSEAQSKFALLVHEAPDYPGAKALLDEAKRGYERSLVEPEQLSAKGRFRRWWEKRSDSEKAALAVTIAAAIIGSVIAGCFALGAALVEVVGPSVVGGPSRPLAGGTATSTSVGAIVSPSGIISQGDLIATPTLTYTFTPSPTPPATVLPTDTTTPIPIDKPASAAPTDKLTPVSPTPTPTPVPIVLMQTNTPTPSPLPRATPTPTLLPPPTPKRPLGGKNSVNIERQTNTVNLEWQWDYSLEKVGGDAQFSLRIHHESKSIECVHIQLRENLISEHRMTCPSGRYYWQVVAVVPDPTQPSGWREVSLPSEPQYFDFVVPQDDPVDPPCNPPWC